MCSACQSVMDCRSLCASVCVCSGQSVRLRDNKPQLKNSHFKTEWPMFKFTLGSDGLWSKKVFWGLLRQFEHFNNKFAHVSVTARLPLYLPPVTSKLFAEKKRKENTSCAEQSARLTFSVFRHVGEFSSFSGQPSANATAAGTPDVLAVVWHCRSNRASACVLIWSIFIEISPQTEGSTTHSHICLTSGLPQLAVLVGSWRSSPCGWTVDSNWMACI